MKYLQLKSTFGWSLSYLVALLRQQLFVYRDLWVWIENPFEPPPISETPPELDWRTEFSANLDSSDFMKKYANELM